MIAIAKSHRDHHVKIWRRTRSADEPRSPAIMNPRLWVIFVGMVLAVIVVEWVLRERRPPADIVSRNVVSIDGVECEYRVVVPRNGERPLPVIFAFHGVGGSADGLARPTQWDWLAAEHACLLVYPNAKNGMWATVAIESDRLDRNRDVRVFDALLEQVAEDYAVDRDRVGVMGMSNGAEFVQILAAARPNTIARVVAHSGPRPRDLAVTHDFPPLLMIVGSLDHADMIRADAEWYRARGCDVTFISVPDLGHRWSRSHNERMWNFLIGR